MMMGGDAELNAALSASSMEAMGFAMEMPDEEPELLMEG